MCKSVLNVLDSILVQTKYTESIYTVHVDNRSSKIPGGGVVNKDLSYFLIMLAVISKIW